jgi:hypothetical protein
MSGSGTLTASGIYADHLLAGGAAARRKLKRAMAVSLAGQIGQRVFESSYAADDLRQKAAHEIGHAIARYILGNPKSTLALAIWDSGGTCGTLADLEEARQQYGVAPGDFERVDDYGNGFQLAGCENPKASIDAALCRLFLQRRYRYLAAALTYLLLTERFLDSNRVFEIIRAHLGPRKERVLDEGN